MYILISMSRFKYLIKHANPLREYALKIGFIRIVLSHDIAI
jgi:hypothetical protein